RDRERRRDEREVVPIEEAGLERASEREGEKYEREPRPSRTPPPPDDASRDRDREREAEVPPDVPEATRQTLRPVRDRQLPVEPAVREGPVPELRPHSGERERHGDAERGRRGARRPPGELARCGAPSRDEDRQRADEGGQHRGLLDPERRRAERAARDQ